MTVALALGLTNMAVTAVKILYLLYFYGLYYASSLRPFYSLARNYL